MAIEIKPNEHWNATERDAKVATGECPDGSV